MKKNIPPGVSIAIILVCLVGIVFYAWKVSGPGGESAVGVGKDGKMMTTEDGQNLMRGMRGIGAPAKGDAEEKGKAANP